MLLSRGLIRDIRGRFHISHNLVAVSVLYIGERPENDSLTTRSHRRPKQERKLERRIIMKTKLLKSITSCFLFACALASLIASMALGTSATARAAIAPLTCSVHTLHGSYLFATVSINGVIITSSGTPGTYTVNADCTGTLTFTGGAGYDIFVELNGQQLWMIQTSGPTPAVFEGTATRVP
ncbi:MAG: hypothetical protein DME76_16625 [Verrucomicrobia bacterium]|nr:MAG: hypothetical protein DME76_16625 [Verrucomicrobiota bacterium]